MSAVNIFAIGWLAVGTIYGAALAKRYALSVGQGAFIVTLSAALWPFLALNERD